MTNAVERIDDHAVSQLEPVHERRTMNDAELVERVAGPVAGRLTRLALQNGTTLHELINAGGTRTWPAGVRRRLDAASALVRRADRSRPVRTRISGPKSMVTYVSQRHLPLAVEHFGLLLLSAKHHVLRDTVVGIGTTCMAPVDTKAVARQIASLPTAAIATWHNHPSGDPCPSEADSGIWEKINDVAKLFGTEALDHVVVTWPDGPWHSEKEAGRL